MYNTLLYVQEAYHFVDIMVCCFVILFYFKQSAKITKQHTMIDINKMISQTLQEQCFYQS